MVPPSQHASRKSGHQSLAFLEERWRRGLSSYSGDHCPLPNSGSHRRASAHSHAHAHKHTCAHTQQTTCTHSTPYATLYSCQRFPLYKSTFPHRSFVNDLFRCCLLLSLYINRESAVCSYTGMKGGRGDRRTRQPVMSLTRPFSCSPGSDCLQPLRRSEVGLGLHCPWCLEVRWY